MERQKVNIKIDISSLPSIYALKRNRTIIEFPIIIGIYKITSPTGKIYIGLANDIYSRFYVYKKLMCKRQPKLYNSFKKYGVENHIFEIIHKCNEEELNFWESHYGKLFKVTCKNGLNIRECGGSKGKLSEKTKIKIKKSLKGKYVGEKHWNFGKKDSEETKKNKSNGNKGRIVSLETRMKMSLKKKGKKQSAEHIKKRTQNQLGRKIKRKLIAKKRCARLRHSKRKILTQKTKNLIGEKAKIRFSNPNNHPWTGREHKKSTKKIMSEKAKIRFSNPKNNTMYGRRGKNSPHFGKKHSDDRIANRVKKTKETKLKNNKKTEKLIKQIINDFKKLNCGLD